MKPSPGNLSLVGTTLAFASAVLYLIAYWGAFSLNIFQFVSLDGLAGAAIIPLASIASMFAFYVLFFGPLLTHIDAEPSALIVNQAPDSHFPVTQKRKLVLFGIVLLVGWVVYVVVFRALHQVPYALAIFMAAGAGYHASNAQSMAEQIPNQSLRPIVLGFLLAIPALSFAHGFVSSYSLMFRYGDFLYVCESHLKNPAQNQMGNELRFVGKAGDFFFFVQDPNLTDLRVLKYEEFRFLTFKKSSAAVRSIEATFDAKNGIAPRSLCDDAR